MRGAKPQPTALKLIKGETRKERLNPNEPKPVPVAPKCPPYVKGLARRIWKEYAPKLERLGILTEVDGLAFADLCLMQADFLHYRKRIEEEGDVFTTDKGYRGQDPVFVMAHKSLDKAKALFAEFGLTPSARTRLSIEIEDGDEFDEFT